MLFSPARFDGKLVSLTDTDGGVYEGYCSYNSAEYNEHEFGVDEDGVQIGYMLFYRKYIRKIKVIEDFSEDYGKLEFEALTDGYDLTDELLSSEDDTHVIRMLRCLCEFYDRKKDERIIERVKSLTEYGSEEVKAEAKKFLNKQGIM